MGFSCPALSRIVMTMTPSAIKPNREATATVGQSHSGQRPAHRPATDSRRRVFVAAIDGSASWFRSGSSTRPRRAPRAVTGEAGNGGPVVGRMGPGPADGAWGPAGPALRRRPGSACGRRRQGRPEERRQRLGHLLGLLEPPLRLLGYHLRHQGRPRPAPRAVPCSAARRPSRNGPGTGPRGCRPRTAAGPPGGSRGCSPGCRYRRGCRPTASRICSGAM